MLAGVLSHCGMMLIKSCQGNAAGSQAWCIKRLVTVFSRAAKRPHRPRSLVLRRLMVLAGIDIPQEAPRRPHDDSDDSSSITTTESESEHVSTDLDDEDEHEPCEGGDKDASSSGGVGIEVPLKPLLAAVKSPAPSSQSKPVQEQVESGSKGLGSGSQRDVVSRSASQESPGNMAS